MGISKRKGRHTVGRDILTDVAKWTLVGAIKGHARDHFAEQVREAVALLPPTEQERWAEEWLTEMEAGLEKYGPRWAARFTSGLLRAAREVMRDVQAPAGEDACQGGADAIEERPYSLELILFDELDEAANHVHRELGRKLYFYAEIGLKGGKLAGRRS